MAGQEALARARNIMVARAAYDVAVSLYQTDEIKRHGHIAKPIKYMLNRWHILTRFLNGRIGVANKRVLWVSRSAASPGRSPAPTAVASRPR